MSIVMKLIWTWWVFLSIANFVIVNILLKIFALIPICQINWLSSCALSKLGINDVKPSQNGFGCVFSPFCIFWSNLNRFGVVCSLKVYWIHLWETQALCDDPFWWGAMGTSWVVFLRNTAWGKDSCKRLLEKVLKERKQGSSMG